MCVSYPGITSIGYVFADNLPAETVWFPLIGLPVDVYNPTEIPLSGTAECAVEHTNDSNGSAESLTLTFSSALRLPRHKAVAFVVTDANGQLWLIGQPELPHLAITATQQTGTPDGTPAVYAYEVRHKAPICLKPCQIVDKR